MSLFSKLPILLSPATALDWPPIPELRWRRTDAHASDAPATVSLRAAIALLESYEPLCAHTREAVIWALEAAALNPIVPEFKTGVLQT